MTEPPTSVRCILYSTTTQKKSVIDSITSLRSCFSSTPAILTRLKTLVILCRYRNIFCVPRNASVSFLSQINFNNVTSFTYHNPFIYLEEKPSEQSKKKTRKKTPKKAKGKAKGKGKQHVQEIEENTSKTAEGRVKQQVQEIEENMVLGHVFKQE